jgi:hypothetical protein
MSPSSGLINDNIDLIAVDFPAPFGPRKPNISPSFISKERLSTAFRFPNDFVKFFTDKITFAISDFPYFHYNKKEQ